jgi:hypothetical protein
MVIKIIFLLLIISFLLYTIVSVYLIDIKTKRWAYFNKKLLKYSDEIKDSYIKLSFLTDVSIWTFGKVKNKKEQKEFEREILSKYIDNIPSLKQEIRNKKIDNLLNF